LVPSDEAILSVPVSRRRHAHSGWLLSRSRPEESDG
jgi:hypothetical protein